MSAHLRTQNWTAVVLEFVVVVVGVFIGLQASNWNTDLADRRREARVLADIATDLRQDREELASGRTIALTRIGAAAYVLEKASGQRPTTLNTFSIDNRSLSADGILRVPPTPTPSDQDRQALWATFVTGYYPTPSTTSFDSLTSAGQLNIIRDADLLREIQTYRLVLDGLGATQENALRPMMIGVREVGEANGLSAFGSVDEATLIRQVAASPQLAATLESQLGWFTIHITQIDSTDRRAAALLKRLNEAGVR